MPTTQRVAQKFSQTRLPRRGWGACQAAIEQPESEGMVRAGESSLENAQDGVDGKKLGALHASGTAASDLRLVHDAGAWHSGAATQAVRDQAGGRSQGLGGELADRCIGEGSARVAGQDRSAKQNPRASATVEQVTH
jgi:hypothetical protein